MKANIKDFKPEIFQLTNAGFEVSINDTRILKYRRYGLERANLYTVETGDDRQPLIETPDFSDAFQMFKETANN